MLIVRAVLQEYLGIAGNPDFCKLSAKLAFGADSKALQEGRAATVQSLSGTGSLRVCTQKCLFASSWYFCVNSIHRRTPSWRAVQQRQPMHKTEMKNLQ